MADTKGLAWRGRYYVKKGGGSRRVGVDGQEDVLGGFVLPPYSVPVRYWMSWKFIGTVATSAVHTQSYLKFGARVADLPNDQEKQESAADVEVETMVGRYLPIANAYQGDDALETDAGLPGDVESVNDYYRRTAFVDREVLLGLPNNGFLAADNALHYAHFGSARGKIDHSHLNIAAGHFIGWSAWQDEIPDAEDDALQMWGEENDLESLYKLLTDNVGSDAALVQVLAGTGMSSNLMRYLNQAFVGTGVSGYEAEVLQAYTSLTVQVELYEPATSGKILTPG